jgi:type II secretory pathway predicted ATPase ExeA
MYERFFGLADAPFRLTPDPRYLFLSSKHADAIAHLRLGLQESSGFVCITGDVGTGKTTLLRAFLTDLGPEVATAYIFNPALTALELLQTINSELGLPASSTSQKALIDALNAHLLSQREAGRRSIVVIDEAQNLSIDVLEQLRMLSNLETTTEKLLRIVLVGQPQLRTLLTHPELIQLNQRITLRWHMGPLAHHETVAYIQHRLAIASGAETTPEIFTAPAMRLVHRWSGGVPRLINMISHRALLAAFAADEATVGTRAVRQAYREIGVVPLARSRTPRRGLWGALAAAAGISAIAFGVARFGWPPALGGVVLGEHEVANEVRPPDAEPPPAPPPPPDAQPPSSGPDAAVAAARPDEPPPPTPGNDAPPAEPNGEPPAAAAPEVAVAPEPAPAEPAPEPAPPPEAPPGGAPPTEAPPAIAAPADPPAPAAAPAIDAAPVENDAADPDEPAEVARLEPPADPAPAAPPAEVPPPTEEAPPAIPMLPAADVVTRLADTPRDESATSSIKAVLAAWRVRPLERNEGGTIADLTGIAQRRGLDHLPIVGNVSMLRLLDLPAILEMRLPETDGPRFVALTELGLDSSVVTLDGTQTRVPAAFIDRHWFGQAHVLWRDFDALGRTFGREATGPPVARLQDLLRRVGVYKGPAHGRFDDATSDAVLDFQRSRFLQVDGRIGRLTRIVLYAAVGGYPRPTLSAPPGAPS